MELKRMVSLLDYDLKIAYLRIITYCIEAFIAKETPHNQKHYLFTGIVTPILE